MLKIVDEAIEHDNFPMTWQSFGYMTKHDPPLHTSGSMMALASTCSVDAGAMKIYRYMGPNLERKMWLAVDRTVISIGEPGRTRS